MFRYEGYDAHGVKRVYGEDKFDQTALGFCKEKAADYVKRRPDTGPLDLWRFEEARGIPAYYDYVGE